MTGLGVLAFLGSCGGDDKQSVPLSELPPKYARALCTAYQNCFGPVFDLFLNGTDCLAVTEQRIRNGTFPLLQAHVDQGKMAYDGSKAEACLASIASRTCAQMLERDSEACLAALDGKVELGGACTLDEDCKGKALCKSASGTCPGQCVPLLVAGQACGDDSDCQDGLQCSSDTRLCVAPSASGQACEYGSPPCGPGLLCLGKDDDKREPGKCRAAAEALTTPSGSACDAQNGQLCVSGASCVAQSFTLLTSTIDWLCVPTGSYAAGGDCKPGFPDACARGYYCKTGTGLAALSGTCTAIPAAGGACAGGLSSCQPGAACVSGTCQNLAPNGVSCTGDAMCYSENCGDSGGCEPKLPCK